MSKRDIPEKVWLEIKTRYQSGESMSKLATEYGVSKGGISSKAKKENWQVIEQEFNQIINSNNMIKKSIERIEQVIEQKQMPIMEKLLSSKTELQFSFMSLMHQGLIGISNILSQAEDLPVDKRARTYSNIGMNIDNLGKSSGIIGNKEIEINNNQQNNTQFNSENPVVINVIPVSKKV